MDYNKKVGQRIQEYREKAKMSQETLGEYVGLSSTSISNIERGLHYPSMDNFIKIANSLGVSADLLLSDVVDSACISNRRNSPDIMTAGTLSRISMSSCSFSRITDLSLLTLRF